MRLTLPGTKQTLDFQRINTIFPKLSTTLYVLLAIDIFFILLHLYTFSLPAIEGNIKNLRLDMDFGYAEMFQYLKFLCVAVLLLYLLVKEKLSIYLVWALFFIVLFSDDAFAFHEGFGTTFVQYFDISPAFGLRAQDLGELAIAGFLGLIFVLPILYTLFFAGLKSKMVSIHYILLVGLLIFFGVGIDMLHSLLTFLPGSGILSVVEDGGEMLAGSLMVWYTLFLLFQSRNKNAYGK